MRWRGRSLHGTLRYPERAGDFSHLQPFEYAQYEYITRALGQRPDRLPEALDGLPTSEDALRR